MRQNQLLWIVSGIFLALLLIGVITTNNVQIVIGSQPPIVEAGLPTTTPIAPTALPQPTVAPTQVPLPTMAPTNTLQPTAVATDIPQPTHEHKKPTPIAPTATTIPITPTTIPGQPELSIVKTASPSQVQPGEKVVFTIVIKNSGNTAAPDVIITDKVPTPLQVVDLYSDRGDIVVDGQQVTAYPQVLNPGERVTIRITVRVPASTSAGTIANTAVVTTSLPDDTTDNLSTTTITVEPRQSALRLPHTANPLDPSEQPFLAVYWPLLVLAVGLICLGAATHYGIFRQKTQLITVGHAPKGINPMEYQHVLAQHVRIPIDAVVSMWRAGTPTSELVTYVASKNPNVDRLAISIAVQKVLQAAALGKD